MLKTTQKNKKIIGLIGPIASGKDTAAKYISERTGFEIFTISDVLREEAKERNIPLIRQNLIDLSRKFSKENGDHYLAEVLLKKIKGNAIIVGMRQLGQLSYLKDKSDFFIITVDAKQEIRFNRLKGRKRADDPITFEEFVRLEKEDDTTNKVQRLSECMKHAKYTIYNNDGLSELKQQIDTVLIKEKLIHL
jgi:dephospho-CoA kinase